MKSNGWKTKSKAILDSQLITLGFKQTEVGVIPDDWSVVDYVSFGQVIDGDRGSHYPSVSDLKDAGHCLFLNAGNVTKNGFRFTDCKFISVEKTQQGQTGAR
jgi:type I restriction enzyme S subunit